MGPLAVPSWPRYPAPLAVPLLQNFPRSDTASLLSTGNGLFCCLYKTPEDRDESAQTLLLAETARNKGTEPQFQTNQDRPIIQSRRPVFMHSEEARVESTVSSTMSCSYWQGIEPLTLPIRIFYGLMRPDHTWALIHLAHRMAW